MPELGKCKRCPRPLEDAGLKTCRRCRQLISAGRLRRVAGRRDSGRCACGREPMAGRAQCARCNKYHWKKVESRSRRRALGLCRCGRPLRRQDVESCQRCYDIGVAQSKRNEGSLDAWLVKLARNARSIDRIKGWQCDIDTDFLRQLLHRQGGVCAQSGLPMTVAKGCLRSISLDRLDSMRGHTRDNVQLICRVLNLGKGKAPNAALEQFLSEFRALIVTQIGLASSPARISST